MVWATGVPSQSQGQDAILIGFLWCGDADGGGGGAGGGGGGRRRGGGGAYECLQRVWACRHQGATRLSRTLTSNTDV